MVFLKLFNDIVNANSITSRVKKAGYNTQYQFWRETFMENRTKMF